MSDKPEGGVGQAILGVRYLCCVTLCRRFLYNLAIAAQAMERANPHKIRALESATSHRVAAFEGPPNSFEGGVGSHKGILVHLGGPHYTKMLEPMYAHIAGRTQATMSEQRSHLYDKISPGDLSGCGPREATEITNTLPPEPAQPK